MASAQPDTAAGQRDSAGIWVGNGQSARRAENVHGLPVPRLPETAQACPVWLAVTTVDARGRLGDRSALRFLNWRPGIPVAIRLSGPAIFVTRGGGSARVTSLGHLRLPVGIRRFCGLVSGAQVLLSASARDDVIAVYPAAVAIRALSLLGAE